LEQALLFAQRMANYDDNGESSSILCVDGTTKHLCRSVTYIQILPYNEKPLIVKSILTTSSNFIMSPCPCDILTTQFLMLFFSHYEYIFCFYNLSTLP